MSDPDQVKSYLIRGSSFALRFIANFAKALPLDPLAAIVYIIFRGLKYGNKGDYDQAIAKYDQALGLAVAYNNRGFAYHLAGSLLVVFLVVVLPLGFLGLAVAYNYRGLVYYLAEFAFCFAILLAFVLPLLVLAVAYNYRDRGRAYHLAGSLLVVFLVVVLPEPVVVLLLVFAVAYNRFRFRGPCHNLQGPGRRL